MGILLTCKKETAKISPCKKKGLPNGNFTGHIFLIKPTPSFLISNRKGRRICLRPFLLCNVRGCNKEVFYRRCEKADIGAPFCALCIGGGSKKPQNLSAGRFTLQGKKDIIKGNTNFGKWKTKRRK
ncbi:MAG: hypothetical protein ACOYIE_08075 [Agathobaculum sp.]|jgi:hypothetical protein|uniref:hypothetical protein n=1 Tax=Agathobaculum sp. TaxID=2048138 RepID=UPI003D8F41FC